MSPRRGWKKNHEPEIDMQSFETGMALARHAEDMSDHPQAVPEVEVKPGPVTVKSRTTPGACPHCGANPMIPTRDGLHQCQCRHA